jgi:hypothetical protein
MSRTRLVFSNNEWLSVELPPGHDPNWSEEDTYYYATVWALAYRKGFSTYKSKILAEAAVSKKMYIGILFTSDIEHELKGLEE